MSVLFRKTGGTITGVVTGLGWDVKEWPAKKAGGDPYSTLTAVLAIQPDGANESIDRYINAGFFYSDTMAIEDNVIKCDEDAAPIRETTDFARLIGTLVEKGFPESRLTAKDFSGIVGTRLTLTNKIDEAATKQFGKRKGKDGKPYNRDYPVIEAVLALPDEQRAAAAPKKNGVAGKATPVAAKSKGKATLVPSADLDPNRGDEIMVQLLDATKDNTLAKGRVSGAMVKFQLDEVASGLSREERDAWRAYLITKEYTDGVKARGVIVYDDDTETFSLA